MNSTKILFWVPRILSIIVILFISLFALDAFQPERSIWDQVEDFATHLIPSFILFVLLLVAWKWELIGGAIFLLLGLIFSPIVFNLNYNLNHSVVKSLIAIGLITLPFIFIGVIFMYSSYKIKGKKH